MPPVDAIDPKDWQILRTTPLFRSTPPRTARSLLSGHIVETLPAGTTLYRQGEAATWMYVIISGAIKVYRTATSGGEAVVTLLRTGNLLGDAAIAVGRTHPASAELVVTSRIFRIEASSLRARILSYPPLALPLLSSISHQSELLADQLAKIKILSSAELVADFLAGLCPTEGGECHLELPFPKVLIAKSLGIKPESFSRALAKLRPFGVRVENEHIWIADTGQLTRMRQHSIARRQAHRLLNEG